MEIKKLKLCMIGCRGHYGIVLDDLPALPEIEVAGISSGCGDAVSPLKEACAKLGRSPAEYGDWRRMLDELRPDIVCIDGPFELHAEMCEEALKKGIHVVCEKPIALEIAGLRRIERAFTEAGGVHLTAMMNLRYNPAFLSAWKAVKGGAVGKLKSIYTRKSYKLGKRSDFFKSRPSYGGTIPWVGAHSIDWTCWFSGSKFKTVRAIHTCEDNSGNGALEVAAQCQFTMENGVMALADIDYLRPAGASTHGDDRIRVAGTKGVVEVAGGRALIIDAAGERELEPVQGGSVFVDFVRQIQGRSASLIGAGDVFAVTEACLLARESADNGGKVMEFNG